MLSPGQWHLHVPKDSQENLRYRRWLIEECRKSKTIRQAVLAACRQDILFYINTFIFQFNPDNLDHEAEPFLTFEFQEHAILGGDVEIDGELVHRWGILECLEDEEDARWPKSRKMGASWVVLITFDWLCIFHDRKTIGVLSRDEDSVDKMGDPNSLFWKIEFMHDHLPDWLKGPIVKKKMLFSYERTDSIMVGEANTISAFVSGRATALLIDEFGQFKNGAETFDMTSDVAKCRIFVFTHREQAGMAYELCFDSKYKFMREIKTHWSQHPERNKGLYRYDEETNQIEVLDKLFSYPVDFDFVYEAKPVGGPYPGIRSPWYDRECRRRSDRDVSMNLDIDPRGATDKFFDPYRIQILKAEFVTAPLWRGSLRYNKETGRPIELFEEVDGLIKLWITPRSRTEMPPMRAGAGSDVSAGSGATPSCLSLMNADTGEKVLEYAYALIFPNEFACFVVSVCRLFQDRHGNFPLLAWEIQGGNAFGRMVRDLGYENVYVRRDEDAIGAPRDNKGRPGINTNAQKLPMFNDYRDALYDRRCFNHSDIALDETLKFVYSTRGVEYRGREKPTKVGQEGSMATIHHGDIVSADAIAWKMCEELGVNQARMIEALIPYGSLAWRRQKAHNVRQDAWA